MANFMSYENASEIFQSVLDYINAHAGDGTVKSASVNGSSLSPDDNGVLDFPNLLQTLNVNGTDYTVDNNGKITLSNIIPSNYVKTVSVNNGYQFSPDTNGNVDLTISTYTLEVKGGGSSASGSPLYNGVITNKITTSTYNSLIAFTMNNGTLIEMWAPTRGAHMKLFYDLEGWLHILEVSDLAVYTSGNGRIYIPYNGNNNTWNVRVLNGEIIGVDNSGESFAISPTSNLTEDITCQNEIVPSVITYFSSRATSGSGHYSATSASFDAQSIADNNYTDFSLGGQSATIDLPTPSVNTCICKRYIRFVNTTTGTYTITFKYGDYTLNTFSMTDKSIRLVCCEWSPLDQSYTWRIS